MLRLQTPPHSSTMGILAWSGSSFDQCNRSIAYSAGCMLRDKVSTCCPSHWYRICDGFLLDCMCIVVDNKACGTNGRILIRLESYLSTKADADELARQPC